MACLDLALSHLLEQTNQSASFSTDLTTYFPELLEHTSLLDSLALLKTHLKDFKSPRKDDVVNIRKELARFHTQRHPEFLQLLGEARAKRDA